MSYLRNRLLPPVVPDFEPADFERPALDLRDTVRSALVKKGTPRSRNSNTAAAVRTVIREVDKIAKDDPVQLFELSEKIELISLEVLIEMRFSPSSNLWIEYAFRAGCYVRRCQQNLYRLQKETKYGWQHSPSIGSS